MRVLMITQSLDRGDRLLGFTHGWVEALAARVDHLAVLALTVGDYALPPNVAVASMGRERAERGRGRLGLLAGFARGLWRYGPQADAILVHMVPRYAWLAALLLPLRRSPITLWYTHRGVDRDLRWALRAVRHVATAHESSFPLGSDKVHALGHGIDTARFTPADQDTGQDKGQDSGLKPTVSDAPTVISLGRLSRIKSHEVLIRAAAILQDEYARTDVRFRIVGAVPPGDPPDYRDFLAAEIRHLRLRDRVSLEAPVPAEAVPVLLRNMQVAVNLSPPGLFDKAALEAMLCGVPTILMNPAFDALLGDHAADLRLESGEDAAALAAKIAALLARPLEDRRAMMAGIRARVAAAHSLTGLMDRLAALLAS